MSFFFFFAFSVVFSSADIIKQPFLEVCITVQQVLQNRCCGKHIPTTRHQPLGEISCVDSSPSLYYDSKHCLLLHFQPLLSSFSPQPKAKNLRKGQTLKSIEVSSLYSCEVMEGLVVVEMTPLCLVAI